MGDRILVVKLSSIGDVVRTLPAVHALRQKFPDAFIGWAVERRAEEIVRHCPDVDDVYALSIPMGSGLTPQVWRKCVHVCGGWTQGVSEIRKKRFDVALDFQGLFKSGLLSWLSGAPRRVGLGDNRREFCHLFMNELAETTSLHALDRYASLVAHLGCDVSSPKYALRIPDEAETFAEEFLEKNGLRGGELLLGINPGASHPINRWEPERFAGVADLAAGKLSARIVVFGGPGDVEMEKRISRSAHCRTVSAAGKTTLMQLAALLKRCDVLVGCDTGPIHLAVAVGTPVVAIAGPADPRRTGPRGARAWVVRSDLPCQPCLRKPTCTDIECMRLVTPEMVMEAVEKALASHSTGNPELRSQELE